MASVAGAAPTAALISIGEELLEGRIADTNSGHFARTLLQLGFHVQSMATLGDGVGELQELLRRLDGRVDLIVSTGGLGPTADDRVRTEVAVVLGVPLVPVPEEGAVEYLAEVYRRYHPHPAPESFLAQAKLPQGALALRNRAGSAWAFAADLPQGTRLYGLPGPPAECQDAFHHGGGMEDLRQRFPDASELAYRVLHTAGAPESVIESLVEPHFRRSNPRLGITANADKVSLSLLAKGEPGDASAQQVLERSCAELLPLLKPLHWGQDQQTLASVVVDALRSAGQSVAVAESCTGGRLAAALTEVPGASQVFTHGWVTYADAAKSGQLGVPEALLREHGAVSAPVAAAMADGARTAAGADWGLGVTGIAGPGGGSAEKPVGTVYLALRGDGVAHDLPRRQFSRAGRDSIQRQSVRDALDMLRRALAGLPPLP